MNHIRNVFESAVRIGMKGTLKSYFISSETNTYIGMVEIEGKTYELPIVNFQGFFITTPPKATNVIFCFKSESFDEPVAIVCN